MHGVIQSAPPIMGQLKFSGSMFIFIYGFLRAFVNIVHITPYCDLLRLLELNISVNSIKFVERLNRNRRIFTRKSD